jgi:glycosyltransferase involved in cell wall biosynthesis
MENGTPVYNGHALGELRNISNRLSKGEILVCFDDDDFYPKTRVEHAVSMLVNSKSEIAGCSSKYLYDYCLQRLYRFKQFGPNHSTNDCFAYKRSYLEKNSYDPTLHMAEEAGFTNKFSNPMIQLDPKHTIIGSSHWQNTFNKKEICIYSCIWANPQKPEEGYLYPQTVSHDQNAEEIMGKEIFEKYHSIFNKPSQSDFDVVYFCGGTSIEWDATSLSLGGSEQAIVHICQEWVKMGLKVAVYAKLTSEVIYNGVNYIDWKKFPFHKQHKNVILWRMSGINCGLPFPIKTNKLFVDYHDNNFVFRHEYLPYIDKIDTIFFKSEFHLECYEKHFKIKPENYAVIPNGIRISDFSIDPGIKREPFRFCYCSSYDRGLIELLQFVWPIVHHNFPQSELHIYYGLATEMNAQVKQNTILLMGQPGVMDHGRRPMDEIINEKWKSSFQLYITDCDGEIDCISIRESLVSGCVPLISNTGVFKNRDGLHFNLTRTQEGYQQIAQGICNLLTKPEFIEMARKQFKVSESIIDWKTVAEKWKCYFN